MSTLTSDDVTKPLQCCYCWRKTCEVCTGCWEPICLPCIMREEIQAQHPPGEQCDVTWRPTLEVALAPDSGSFLETCCSERQKSPEAR